MNIRSWNEQQKDRGNIFDCYIFFNMSSLQTLKLYARGRPFAKKVNVYMSIIFVISIIHILNTSCSVSGGKNVYFVTRGE